MRNISWLSVVNVIYWWETCMVELNKTGYVCMTQTETHTNLCILDPSCIINWIYRANIICFHSVYFPFHSTLVLQLLLGPGLPQQTPLFCCLLPVSSILVFLESDVFLQWHPPILLLVFSLVLNYEISHWSWIMKFHIKSLFLGGDLFIFHSYKMTCPS